MGNLLPSATVVLLASRVLGFVLVVGVVVVGGVETPLDHLLAVLLCDDRLQLVGGKGVHMTSLGCDEQENLRTGESRELVGLDGQGKQASK